MNIIRYSLFRLKEITTLNSTLAPRLPHSNTTHLRSLSSWLLSRPAVELQNPRCRTLPSQAEGSGIFQHVPWRSQQVRTRKRGTEYQPKNIKRLRTHGWRTRISTQGGIEVILRRMLKGRKSLTH